MLPLRTIGRAGESGAARNSRMPLAGSAVRRNPRSVQFGTWSHRQRSRCCTGHGCPLGNGSSCY
eukprot:5537908-Pleurochrysis_carterae.AAC.1